MKNTWVKTGIMYKYIDYIEMNFEYEFSGSSAVEIKTEYSITAYLQDCTDLTAKFCGVRNFPLYR